MLLLPLVLNNTSHQQRKKSTKAIASIIIVGCLLQFYSAVFDFDASSSYYGLGNTIDYDHYVPGHRFLLVDTNKDKEEDGTTPNQQQTFSWRGSQHHVTLKPRSDEDAKNIRRRAVIAARKRALGVTSENELYTSLTPEMASSISTTANKENIPPPERQVNVTSYDIDSAILAVRAFHKEILFFVYDSATDDFVIVHNKPSCDGGCKSTYAIAPVVSYALRKNYPQRFQGSKSGDLLFLISVGDMPRVRRPCLFEENKYCKSENWAPILQFGSVLVDTKYMPSVIPMPQSPRPHIPCVDEYQSSGKICQDLLPRVIIDASAATTNQDDNMNNEGGEGHSGRTTIDPIESTGQHFKHGLVYGEEETSNPNYWDDLIPQVIWRGTDFNFLRTLYPDMGSLTYEDTIRPHDDETRKLYEEQHAPVDVVARSAIKNLWNMDNQKDMLTPRWHGVLLTSEAELDLRQEGTMSSSYEQEYDLNEDALSSSYKTERTKIPWVNIKFASCNVNGQKVPSSQNPEFQLLQDEFGITAIGKSMTMIEQARYKYHIDLGGGGGTTWTGTIEKLALPGVLFHHVTPTKDWYHDHLVPWVHYIPVSVDLSDLRAKFDWAEAHPEETQRIAEAGTEFARWMGTLEGYAQLYQEHIVHPLGNIIMAYKKSPRKKYQGLKTLDILKEASDGNFGIVARCSGWPGPDDTSSKCRWRSTGTLGLDVEVM